MKAALNCLVVVLLISPFGSAFSQNDTPGYLGKRFEIYYDLAANPALGSNPDMRNYSGTKNANGVGGQQVYLHTRHDLGFQWTSSRRSSIGMHFSGFRTGYVSGQYPFANNFQDTLGQLRMQGVGLAYRMYPFLKKGSIAPLGAFTQIHYTVYRTSLYDPGVENGDPVEQKFIGMLGIYFGTKNVITDRILMNFGLELNRPFLNRAFTPVTASTSDCCTPGEMVDAFASHTYINLRLGISGLLF